MQPDVIKIVAMVVAGASVLHTFLPPWEAFNDFPRVQKYYKLVVYIVGYVAINGRSTVYSSLSTKDGTQTSRAVNGNGQVPPTPPPAPGVA